MSGQPQHQSRDRQVVHDTLARYRRRVMAVAAVDGALEAAMLAGAVLLVAGPWLAGRPMVAVLVAVASIAGWSVRRAWRAGSRRLELAWSLDAYWRSHDRLSNSLTLAAGPGGDFARAHLRECAAWLARQRPGWPPLRFRRLETALLYLLVAALLLAPGPAGPAGSTAWAADREPAVQDAGARLARRLRQAGHQARRLGLEQLPVLLAAAESEVLNHQRIEPPAPRPVEPPAAESNSTAGDTRPLSGTATAELPPPGGRAGRSSYSPSGKYDGLSAAAYAAAFAELDRRLELGRLNRDELQVLSAHLERVAETLNLSARQDDNRSGSQLARPERPGEAAGGSFDAALAALQQKSFSEFLRRYADHLAGVEPATAGRPTGPAAGSPTTAPVPRRGSRRPLQQVADPDSLPGTSSSSAAGGKPRQAALSTRQSRNGPAGRVAAAGGAGAGSGAGRGELAPAPVLPRPRRVELVELPRRRGHGRTLFRLLEQLGSGGASSAAAASRATELGRLLEHYERLAAETDDSGAIPADRRDYVRQYFTALRRLRLGKQP